MENDFNLALNNLPTMNDKIEYILDCIPFIKEHSARESNNIVTLSAFNLKKTVMSKKGDVYKKFIGTREKTDENYILLCTSCGSANVFYCQTSGDDICTDCGRSVASHHFELDYKDERDMDKTVIYSYKRENHFNEWITQFQAKEVTTVPQHIINDLRIELKKQKIYRQSDITHKKIKELLKKLGYNKYYEHVPYITTCLHGIKPPVMSNELEQKLRSMFHMIQQPFDKACPSERINFLSYSYVLYKFCEILGEDEYLQFFPLLKSREKLYKHDQLWKTITAELNWEYIPTI